MLIFFISTLLFPVLIINKIVFVVILLISIADIRTNKILTISPFLIFIIFLFGYINSFFHNVDKNLSQQFLLSVLSLFLIYPIFKYKIDLGRIAKISGLIMAVYTVISFLIIVVLIDTPISNIFYPFFRDYSSGSNGLREFAEEGILSFHIGTVPFLFLAFSLYVLSFVEKKTIATFLAILVLFITMYISASRGLIIISIFASAYIIFCKSKFRTRIIFLGISVPIVVVVISFMLGNTNVFSSDETSNNVKIGHLISFFDHVDFFNFTLGEGLGSYYFSKGVGKELAHTEITPLDMLRYLGFILTPIMYYMIIFPSNKLKSYLGKNSLYLVIFMIYVVNSFTNPTMFNSYGLLIVLWYWQKILYNDHDIKSCMNNTTLSK